MFGDKEPSLSLSDHAASCRRAAWPSRSRHCASSSLFVCWDVLRHRLAQLCQTNENNTVAGCERISSHSSLYSNLSQCTVALPTAVSSGTKTAGALGVTRTSCCGLKGRVDSMVNWVRPYNLSNFWSLLFMCLSSAGFQKIVSWECARVFFLDGAVPVFSSTIKQCRGMVNHPSAGNFSNEVNGDCCWNPERSLCQRSSCEATVVRGGIYLHYPSLYPGRIIFKPKVHLNRSQSGTEGLCWSQLPKPLGSSESSGWLSNESNSMEQFIFLF